MASLADVSRAAGVSVATVSRALTGSGHAVSAATRQRVLRAAEEVGYTPSALARGLVSRTSNLIGIVVSDIVNPYFSIIARGVNDVATRAGCVTMVSNSDRRPASEVSQIQAMLEYRAKGVIVAGSGYVDPAAHDPFAAVVDQARKQGTDVIALSDRAADCRVITADYHGAAYDITDYLVSLGHRAIVFLEGPGQLATSHERRLGYEECMDRNGLTDLATSVPAGFDFQSGYDATLRLLLERAEVDAIVAANDECAVGAIAALSHAEVPVPQSISVAGIDDLTVAQFVGLSTVSVPLYEMGAMAAQEIISGGRSGAEDEPPALSVLPHRLVVRRSTGVKPPDRQTLAESRRTTDGTVPASSQARRGRSQ